MKTRSGMKSFVVLSAIVALAAVTRAETVHQTIGGDKIYANDGGNAVAKGKMEAKKVDGATSDQVARIKGDMKQWGYVSCWFGLPSPQGKSTVRLRIYVDDPKVAKCMLYTVNKSGQNGIGVLKIPADAKQGTFVNVDVPVETDAEWNGLTIKKAEDSALPGPWIDTVSVVLPD
jgi:hypothetical protein